MAYPMLLATFALFTLLDALITVVGVNIGCVELNPMVTTWGVPYWVIFRATLLGCMLTVFLFGYHFLMEHFPERTRILEITVLILDFYIATVVFSGLFAIYLQLLL